MKGNIQSIQPNGSFQTQYGEMFAFVYTIDGVQYQQNHKTQASPFAVGSELEFEITTQATQQYPAKIRKVQPEQQAFPVANGQAKKPANNRSFALSYAKDLVVSKDIEMQHLFELAERMDRWLTGEVAIGNTAPPTPVPPPAPVQEVAIDATGEFVEPENKLPF